MLITLACVYRCKDRQFSVTTQKENPKTKWDFPYFLEENPTHQVKITGKNTLFQCLHNQSHFYVTSLQTALTDPSRWLS